MNAANESVQETGWGKKSHCSSGEVDGSIPNIKVNDSFAIMPAKDFCGLLKAILR